MLILTRPQIAELILAEIPGVNLPGMWRAAQYACPKLSWLRGKFAAQWQAERNARGLTRTAVAGRPVCDIFSSGMNYPHGEDWERTVSRIAAECRGELYLGVDIGRDHDLTVIWVMEKLGGVCYTRAVITLAKETFDAQEHVLYEWLQLGQVRRCCIDRTGLGRQFAERAGQRFGTYKVEGVNFSGPVKEELAYPVRSAFEDRSLRIPSSPTIRAALRAIKKETTASGNIRFAADRGRNGHADEFWALALALHAGKQQTGLVAVVG